MDARRQAGITRMQNHPDFRWPELQRQRAEAQAQRQTVHLSQPMTADGEEDVYSAICGSLGVRVTGGLR
jgi:hypothetical protein